MEGVATNPLRILNRYALLLSLGHACKSDCSEDFQRHFLLSSSEVVPDETQFVRVHATRDIGKIDSGYTSARRRWTHYRRTRPVDELTHYEVGRALIVAEGIRVLTKIKTENHAVTDKVPDI